jgi:hypothetical protein
MKRTKQRSDDMPIPFDQRKEDSLKRFLDKLKADEDAKNGPGAFDHKVKRGQLLMQKRADELTPEEAAFIKSPPPAKQQ